MADFNININAQVVESNNIAGEALTKGDLVYLANDGKYYKATATLNSKSTTELKIALANAAIDTTINMLVYGYYDYESPILTAGNKYYLSTTTGAVTDQRYEGTNNIIRYIGTAYSTQILLFNPDQTYLSENATKINDVPLNFGHVHNEVDITDLDKYTVAEVDALIASATDINFVHVESPASASWVIAHSLGKFPSVTIQDGSGNNIFGEIVYTDVNNLTLNFNTAFAGTAYLN